MSQEAQARESVHVDEQPIKVESDSEGKIYMLCKIHNIGLIGSGEGGWVPSRSLAQGRCVVLV